MSGGLPAIEMSRDAGEAASSDTEADSPPVICKARGSVCRVSSRFGGQGELRALGGGASGETANDTPEKIGLKLKVCGILVKTVYLGLLPGARPAFSI
jgi:hypothetical protein